MFDKWYWRRVWWSLTFGYKPNVALKIKVLNFIWALLTPAMVIPYCLFSGMAWCFERLSDASGYVAENVWFAVDATMPRRWENKKEAE